MVKAPISVNILSISTGITSVHLTVIQPHQIHHQFRTTTTKSSKEVGRSYAVLMFGMVPTIKNMRERIRLGPLPRILEPHQYTVLSILLKLLKILSTPIQNLALLGPTSSIYCHPDITSLPMDLGNYTLPNCSTTFLQIPTELGQSPRLSCQYPYSQHHPF
jgi:hypothetical protein